MKRKLSMLVCALALVFGILAFGVSAETYYPDADGLYTVSLSFEPTTEYIMVVLKGEFDQTNYIEEYNAAKDSDIIYMEQKLSDEDGNITFGPFVTNGYYNSTIIIGGGSFADPHLAGYLSAKGCSNAASIEISGVKDTYVAKGVGSEDIVVEISADVYDSFGYPSVTDEVVEFKIENNLEDVTFEGNVLTISKFAKEQVFSVTASAGDVSETVYVQVKRDAAKASYIEVYRDASFETAVESINVLGPEGNFPAVTVYARTFDQYCAEITDTYTFTYGGASVGNTFTPSEGTTTLTVKGASGVEKKIEVVTTTRANYKDSALELYELIEECNARLEEDIVLSTEDGKDVFPGQMWTTDAAINSFAYAVVLAQTALDKYGASGYTDGDYEDELYSLEKAVSTFNASFEDGVREDVTELTVDDFTNSFDRVNELKVGASVQLDFSTTPRLHNTTDRIIWTSSDESVATVDEDGFVKSLSKGTVVITAETRGGLKVSKEIKVIKPASTRIELTPRDVYATYGENPVIKASIAPSDSNDIIVWEVDAPAVLDVVVSEDNKLCTIIPKSAGTATITVKSVYGKKTATSTVEVTMPEWEKAASPVASKDSGSLIKGTEVSLETATPDATIYYTLDGTTPSKDNGRIYKNPIVINQSLTLKAVAVGTGVFDSEVAVYNYNIVTSSVKLDKVVARPGETIVVKMTVDNLENAAETTMVVNYPTGVLTLKSADFESFCFVKKENGSVTVSISDSDGISFNGVIGTFTFAVASGAAENDYKLDISESNVVLVDGTSYDAAVYDGEISVNNYILGDADNNGKIGISDVLVIRQYLAGDEYAKNNIMLKAADVDADGDVDNDDAILLSRYCVGWNVTLG